jgi:hypothetical protein
MATFLGKEGVVKVGINSIAEVRSFSITQTAATAEDTVMGDEWTTHKPTMKSWAGQLSCFWDNTNTTGQGALIVGTEVTLKLYPEGTTADDEELTGSVIITSVETQLAHDGIVEASFAFQGNGLLTIGAVE